MSDVWDNVQEILAQAREVQKTWPTIIHGSDVSFDIAFPARTILSEAVEPGVIFVIPPYSTDEFFGPVTTLADLDGAVIL